MARKCDIKDCYTNNPNSLYICDDCLDDLLMNELSMDEVYELYVLANDILSEEEGFKDFMKMAAKIEKVSIDDEQLQNDMENFKNNLFDIFNGIMKTKENNNK